MTTSWLWVEFILPNFSQFQFRRVIHTKILDGHQGKEQLLQPLTAGCSEGQGVLRTPSPCCSNCSPNN